VLKRLFSVIAVLVLCTGVASAQAKMQFAKFPKSPAQFQIHGVDFDTKAPTDKPQAFAKDGELYITLRWKVDAKKYPVCALVEVVDPNQKTDISEQPGELLGMFDMTNGADRMEAGALDLEDGAHTYAIVMVCGDPVALTNMIISDAYQIQYGGKVASQ
jgi:hypothetical protein